MPGPADRPVAAPAVVPVPDHRIVRVLWPVLLAAIVSLFPFTVYSTFLVPIAASVGADEAGVGALRGLGGAAALLTGVAIAPLLTRWPHHRSTVAALLLLAAASMIGAAGSYPALVVFCLGIGTSTAVLTPALLAIATSAFPGTADGGRAATLVTATQSLAAVLAGPVIGVLAVWRGWAGALWITAAMAAVIAAIFLRPGATAAELVDPPGYREAFSRLRARSDLVKLVAIAGLRTASFMGYLSFLAASYHVRFAMDATTFTLVWTLSGASFFAGNYLAGRWARRQARPAGRQPRLLLALSLAGGLVAVLVVFVVPWLAVALAATAVMGFSHAVVAAVVTSLIAHRAGALTVTAYSINAAGMSLGVFAGAAIGGIGLGVAGDPGLAFALALPTLAALAVVATIRALGTHTD